MILALDTGGNQLALGLGMAGRDGAVEMLAVHQVALRHGHGEALPDALAALLAGIGATPGDLDLIVVATGPGGFTGLRVGLAFAGGIALASGAAIVGVPTFDALSAALPPPSAGRDRLIAVDSRRTEPFIRHLDATGRIVSERWIALDALSRLLGGRRVEIAGDAAVPVAAALPAAAAVVIAGAGVDPAVLAGLGHDRRTLARPDPPSPLYLRPPEARPMVGPGAPGG
ncbi:MAG: tRNA (adenosine(37)-N6)-threonylcarbamoyltransferase complex dimerization subunit type 1 TsaB [Azospirillaceae bacterium]